jgi:hypothetical protein
MKARSVLLALLLLQQAVLEEVFRPGDCAPPKAWTAHIHNLVGVARDFEVIEVNEKNFFPDSEVLRQYPRIDCALNVSWQPFEDLFFNFWMAGFVLLLWGCEILHHKLAFNPVYFLLRCFQIRAKTVILLLQRLILRVRLKRSQARLHRLRLIAKNRQLSSNDIRPRARSEQLVNPVDHIN